MSVVWYDGFDNVATAQLAIDYRATAAGIAIGTGRDSTSGVTGTVNSDSMIRDCEPTVADSGAVGLAIFVSAFPGAKRKIFTLLDATDQPVMTLVLRTNGTLDLVQGGEVDNPSFITSDTPVGTGAWIYVEVGFRPSTTAGFLTIRVNGILHKQQGLLNTVLTTWSAVQLFPDAGLDDLYIVDGAGAANWILGPQRIWTAPPGSVGDLADWVSSSGVGQVDDIDEVTSDGDTTYIWADGDLDRSTFIFALPGTVAPGNVYAVGLNAVARDAVAAGIVVRPICRNGGVTRSVPSVAEGFALTSSYKMFRYSWLINPQTLAPWTKATLDLAQFGVERNE